MIMNNEDYFQLALSKCNLDTPNWFTWKDLGKGASYDNLIVREGVNAKKPTQKEIDTKIAEIKLNELRIERNIFLTQSDWVVIREREEGGSVSNFADWKKYRQELRDITNTYKSLDKVKWPTAPSE